MKQFTVVFPLAKLGDIVYILLGEQKPGKPLSGYLNGYGGKVEAGESILEAAGRELREELDIELEDPAFIGTIIHQEKEIFFYLSKTNKREFGDTSEMVGNMWFELSENVFIERMLPGDIEIIRFVREQVGAYFEGEELEEFRIVKEGTEIDKAVVELNKSIGHK